MSRSIPIFHLLFKRAAQHLYHFRLVTYVTEACLEWLTFLAHFLISGHCGFFAGFGRVDKGNKKRIGSSAISMRGRSTHLCIVYTDHEQYLKISRFSSERMATLQNYQHYESNVRVKVIQNLNKVKIVLNCVHKSVCQLQNACMRLSGN